MESKVEVNLLQMCFWIDLKTYCMQHELNNEEEIGSTIENFSFVDFQRKEGDRIKDILWRKRDM